MHSNDEFIVGKSDMGPAVLYVDVAEGNRSAVLHAGYLDVGTWHK